MFVELKQPLMSLKSLSNMNQTEKSVHGPYILSVIYWVFA